MSLHPSINCGTDIGSECSCGSTIYGYGIDESRQMVAQCISCHTAELFDIPDFPPGVKSERFSHRAAEFRQLHQRHLDSHRQQRPNFPSRTHTRQTLEVGLEHAATGADL